MNVVHIATQPGPPRPRPAPPVTLSLSRDLVEDTQQALRVTSAGVRESLVLWAGRTVDAHATVVTHVIEPECIATNDVLIVPKYERVAVARFLRDYDLLIFADLHTHPGAAFLSAADRARPFSSRDGFYAVVVPDFATRAPLDGWRVYEASDGGWEEVELNGRLCTEPV